MIVDNSDSSFKIIAESSNDQIKVHDLEIFVRITEGNGK
jgi:hypothetical protein